MIRFSCVFTRETSFTVQVVIDQFQFSTLEEGNRKNQTWDALRSLNESGVIVVKGTAEETVADACKLAEHFAFFLTVRITIMVFLVYILSLSLSLSLLSLIHI